MAFKKAIPPQNAPDSPEELLLELPRRKIKGILLHQGEIMRAYASQAIDKSDVALQLPTGSGKTLVGLIIAEWRRRKFKERVLYLCPTRQLVNQVVHQSNDYYGLVVNGFTGSHYSYDPVHKAEYLNADRIAVTTYSSLFNTSPYFSEPELIIIDDAHSSENYIAAMWSLKIERKKSSHLPVYVAVCSLIQPYLNSYDFSKLIGESDDLYEAPWVDKLPTPTLHEINDELYSILDTHIDGENSSELLFPWRAIKDHLRSCHVYYTSKEIFIRPLIPPTWSHPPFIDAKQRIFMSATLGSGGDLERLTGRRKIFRLPVPNGWDKQGIGRRLFMFPSLSLTDEKILNMRSQLMALTERSIFLAPGDGQLEAVKKCASNLNYAFFTARDIEDSKQDFINSSQAVAYIANRYDGIDFPGDECRLLFIDGLPKATNAQELFLMFRMGANLLFSERVQTRILQAIGRCTRSLEDYSAVIITGEHLPEYLTDKNRRKYFHPELQAEIEFGIQQSQDTTIDDFVENFTIFLKNDLDWEEANTQILNLRSQVAQCQLPAIQELMDVCEIEIEYQKRMWQGDYEKAIEYAEQIIPLIKSPELRGYRALWHYLAGSASYLLFKNNTPNQRLKFLNHFKHAKEAAPNLPWLVSLSKYLPPEEVINKSIESTNLSKQIENLENYLISLGPVGSRKYLIREKEILTGLLDPDKFENAQKLLGEMFGFNVGKIESDASPDPWWIIGDICIVFEDFVNIQENTELSPTKARQAMSHPNWIRENIKSTSELKIFSVLVSSVKNTTAGALPHLKEVYFWNYDDFVTWARNGLSTIRSLKAQIVEYGDMFWRQQAMDQFIQEQLDIDSICKYLRQNKASERLQINTSS